MRKSLCFLTMVFCMVAGAAFADSIAYDSFDYSASKSNGDAISGADGGTGWSTAWSGNEDKFRTVGLSFSGVPESGGTLETFNGNSTATFRTLDATYGADGTAVWIGVLFNRIADGGNWAGLSLFDGVNERIFMGTVSGAYNMSRFGGSSASTGVSSASAAALILKIDFQSGNESVSMWAETSAVPTTEAALGTADATLSVADFSFDRVRIGSAFPEQYSMDELSMATSFEELYGVAVPEPTTAVMFGLGAVLLLMRRHFRG